MKETDWLPLTHCPIHPGVYKTMHLSTRRLRCEGYSKWMGPDGWSYTFETTELASKATARSAMQSKQWKGILKEET